jgi:hypothetical protein
LPEVARQVLPRPEVALKDYFAELHPITPQGGGSTVSHFTTFPLLRERLDNVELIAVRVSASGVKRPTLTIIGPFPGLLEELWVFWGQSAELNILKNPILDHAFPFI